MNEDAQSTELTVPNQVSADILEYFAQTAETGLEDIDFGGGLPILRVHTSQSTGNELSTGGTPDFGQLFYSGSKTAYDDLLVHILVIKKCQLPEYMNPSQLKSHYLVAGVIAETNEPFVMYIKGMSYNKIWDFQNQIRPFVKNKQRPIPMYAMRVKLYTELEEPQDKKFKAQYVVKYALMKSGDFPQIVGTMDQVQMLKNAADTANSLLEEIIRNKAGEEELDDVYTSKPTEQSYENGEVADSELPPEKVTEVEDISDDIPF